MRAPSERDRRGTRRILWHRRRPWCVPWEDARASCIGGGAAAGLSPSPFPPTQVHTRQVGARRAPARRGGGREGGGGRRAARGGGDRSPRGAPPPGEKLPMGV